MAFLGHWSLTLLYCLWNFAQVDCYMSLFAAVRLSWSDNHFVVTGPVARFARQIAGQGYIVAAPSSYHEFTGPEPLAYDGLGTDAGNDWKIKKVEHPPPFSSSSCHVVQTSLKSVNISC